ncbi:MAG: aspartate kinase [Elusimicrobia bacterium]|nr:aspartate kinase [Elusimicrobiota bacterium]MDE2314228.1 aspartate kinase [Elusimicrobiota bacterium]
MNILVMKFGGTSLADPEKIQRAAARVARARRRGFAVAAVVSAPGQMTDELLSLARRVARRAPARELDSLMAAGEQISIALLASALSGRGAPSVSLTGAQAGVRARGPHGASEIAGVRPARVLAELARGRVAVVAGFQGVDGKGDLATLGRGGSDLTAAALAAALKAWACEIYTDVKGVYTADPRLVPEARKIGKISFSEMLALAEAGAQVMQPRSISFARSRGVRLHVRSAFHDAEGTWIGPDAAGENGVKALAVERVGVRARVSAVGRGLRPEDAEATRKILRSCGIACRRAELSAFRASCEVDAREAVPALRALHKAWQLGRRAA